MARRRSKWSPSAPVAIFLTLIGIAIVGTLWRVILVAFALAAAVEAVIQIVSLSQHRGISEHGPISHFVTRRRRAHRAAADAARRREEAVEAERRARYDRMRTLHGLLKLSPIGFEEAVGDIFSMHGYRNVRGVGGSGDLGIDLECIDPMGWPTIVQCKRYAPSHLVGSPEVQLFIGMLTVHHEHAERGVYVTTSSYTEPAVRLADAHGIMLIDGVEIARMASEAFAANGEVAERAWYPDPSGRHELRYFDGSRWTEHVSDAGRPALDAV